MDQMFDSGTLPELAQGAAIDELDADDLAWIDEELPDDSIRLAAGGMRTVLPTYCWHTDPPHIHDWVAG